MTHDRALELAQQLTAARFPVEVRLVPVQSPLTAAQTGAPEAATVRVPLHCVGCRMTLSRLSALHEILEHLCTLGVVDADSVRVVEA